MHKVLITGSRDWEPDRLIRAELEKLIDLYKKENLLVIHGGARGVDLVSHSVAKSLGIHRARVDALWDTYHKAAGPIRNGIMLAMDPDEALAFHPDISTSKGTADMVKKLEKYGIPTTVISG